MGWVGWKACVCSVEKGGMEVRLVEYVWLSVWLDWMVCDSWWMGVYLWWKLRVGGVTWKGVFSVIC
jgi:hypothetical protein